jgi:hypothetical protein
MREGGTIDNAIVWRYLARRVTGTFNWDGGDERDERDGGGRCSIALAVPIRRSKTREPRIIITISPRKRID